MHKSVLVSTRKVPLKNNFFSNPVSLVFQKWVWAAKKLWPFWIRMRTDLSGRTLRPTTSGSSSLFLLRISASVSASEVSIRCRWRHRWTTSSSKTGSGWQVDSFIHWQLSIAHSVAECFQIESIRVFNVPI